MEHGFQSLIVSRVVKNNYEKGGEGVRSVSHPFVGIDDQGWFGENLVD